MPLFFLRIVNVSSLASPSFIYLYQVMFCEVSFTVFNITHDILQIADITLRIKRVYRYLKRNTFFSAYFFSKHGECRTHRNP